MSRLQAVLEAGRAHRAKQQTQTGSWYLAHHAQLNDERDEELARDRDRMEDLAFEQRPPMHELRVSTAEARAPNAGMTVILGRLMRTPAIPPGRYRLTNDLVKYLADSNSHIKKYILDLSIPGDPHFGVNEFEEIRAWEQRQRELGLMPPPSPDPYTDTEHDDDLYSNQRSQRPGRAWPPQRNQGQPSNGRRPWWPDNQDDYGSDDLYS